LASFAFKFVAQFVEVGCGQGQETAPWPKWDGRAEGVGSGWLQLWPKIIILATGWLPSVFRIIESDRTAAIWLIFCMPVG